MSTTLLQRPTVTTSTRDIDDILSREIRFISNLDYEAIDFDSLDDEPLDETSVLTAETESRLFVQMNRAYYQATVVRAELLDDAPGVLAEELIEAIARADALRNCVAVIFHKLTVSIAKNFVTARHSLDELVSEGDAVLLRAIALFDPTRGFRFSTYATHALRRRFVRYINSREHQHAVPVDFREAPPIPDRRRWTRAYEQRIEAGVEWVERTLFELDPRERYIIRCRFGWGREFEPRTLQEIADELSVSRERVRQLEARGMSKLKNLASTFDGVE